MTVVTYERIGVLINNIKRSKNNINRQNESIKRDFKELNELLKKNNQPEIKLEDIKINDGYSWDEF